MASSRGVGALTPPARERRPLIRATLFVAASLALIALPIAPAEGQDGLSTDPAMLREDTLAWLRVRPSPGTMVRGGEVAGEPMHFERLPNGTVRALIPVPVEAPDSLPVSLIV